jgi:hypothetical protein
MLALTAVLIVGGLLSGVTAQAADSAVAADRDAVAVEQGRRVFLTIYNGDLALVRDVRTLPVAQGRSLLSFTDIPSRIDATSVSLKSLTEEGSIRILEQNYEYDMVSGDQLLRKYLGQRIEVCTADGTEYSGYLISMPGSGGSLILAEEPWGGAITAVERSEIRVIRYPQIPAGLVMKPTLVWSLESTSAETEHEMEVSYLTGGLSWSADYILILDDDDRFADLTGWVTITNTSGVEFEDAELKLVAGNVNRATDEVVYYDLARGEKALSMSPAPAFEERSLFEYHLYKLGFPTTVKNNQTKQIQLLSASNIPVEKQYVFGRIPGSTRWYGYSDNVKVVLRFKNSEENNLGMPLPAGRVRVNKADVDGSLEFVGEDAIEHTPKDEELLLYIGDAFDVVGERENVSTTKVGSNARREKYSIELRNHKSEAVDVRVVETQTSASFEILKASHDFEKLDARTIEFVVQVPADGSSTVTYEVMHTW